MTNDKNAGERDYSEELARIIESFKSKFKAGTADPDNFMTFTQMEMMLSELRRNTSELYLELFEEMLRGVDESKIIRKKKPSTEARGLFSEPTSNTPGLS